MSEDDELPAIYRALSVEGLQRLLSTYIVRLDCARSLYLRETLARRVRFIEAELARRQG